MARRSYGETTEGSFIYVYDHEHLKQCKGICINIYNSNTRCYKCIKKTQDIPDVCMILEGEYSFFLYTLSCACMSADWHQSTCSISTENQNALGIF